MSHKQKRLCIPLEIKYKIIKSIDRKKSTEEILKEFKDYLRADYSISKIKKNRDQIIKSFESSTSSKVKSLKKSKYPEIEKGLIEFISKSNSHGMPVNTLLLREKANELALNNGFIDFKCSNGFIDRFKSRNAIIFETFHGEADGVSEITCNEWIDTKLPELVKDFKADDIFNGDEFGLFWRILPNKSYVVKGKKFKTGKKSKERVSVLICANMTGTEKLRPLVIGKAQEPRCFRNKKRLPIIYRNNENSWMTSEIFTKFLKNWNKKMIKKKRKIALIIDNCPSHPFVCLSNIKLIFLPPNTTSRLQPMDMGVIHSLKSLYRLKIARKLLALLECKPNPTVKDINLYEGLMMLKSAWDEVSKKTIRNCFIKSGLKFNENESNETEEHEVEFDFSFWSQLTQRLDLHESDFDEFVNFDNGIAINDEENSLETNEYSGEETDYYYSETEQLSDDEVEEPLMLTDALNAITSLRKYVTQSQGVGRSHDLIDQLENEIYNNRFKNLKQTKITDYLHKN